MGNYTIKPTVNLEPSFSTSVQHNCTVYSEQGCQNLTPNKCVFFVKRNVIQMLMDFKACAE